MKVRCIDNEQWGGDLKVGQIYTVLKKIYGIGNGQYSGVRYLLKEVECFPSGVFIERFEIVSGCPCDVRDCLKHRGASNGA